MIAQDFSLKARKIEDEFMIIFKRTLRVYKILKYKICINQTGRVSTEFVQKVCQNFEKEHEGIRGDFKIEIKMEKSRKIRVEVGKKWIQNVLGDFPDLTGIF